MLSSDTLTNGPITWRALDIAWHVQIQIISQSKSMILRHLSDRKAVTSV
jgi:hypothetical protein